MKVFLCIFAIVATAMSDLQDTLKKSNDKFTANMFQEVLKTHEGKSCVLSAFSVLSPLAQLAFASVGETHDAILTAIGLPNDNVTKQVFADVNTRLKSVKGIELQQANKIYISDGYALNDEFAASTKEIFNSEVQNIDFGQKEKAANEINAWVEDHTNKRIKDLITADTIGKETAAILVNAINFKGKWTNPFEKFLTQDTDFYVTNDKAIKVPMMSQSNVFKYKDSQKFDSKFIEMEYEGGETSLIVALPNKIDGINDLIAKIKEPAALNSAFDNMTTELVVVSLPRFKIETIIDLKVVLEKMNIVTLFQKGKARLENLLKQPDDLFVDSAIQKAFIEVNEVGTEAAAANEAILGVGSAFNPNTKKFVANHPFIFFLMEKNNILFTGVFRN